MVLLPGARFDIGQDRIWNIKMPIRCHNFNDNAVTYTKTTETKTTEIEAAEVNAARNMSRIGG